MSRAAGHALKGLAWLTSPFVFGMLIATFQGWAYLASRPRMLAGWGLLLVLAVVLPIFLARAGRAAVGHETARQDKNALRTGAAVLLLGAAAAVVTPWRELGAWLATTLAQLTGFALPVPAGNP